MILLRGLRSAGGRQAHASSPDFVFTFERGGAHKCTLFPLCTLLAADQELLLQKAVLFIAVAHGVEAVIAVFLARQKGVKDASELAATAVRVRDSVVETMLKMPLCAQPHLFPLEAAMLSSPHRLLLT